MNFKVPLYGLFIISLICFFSCRAIQVAELYDFPASDDRLILSGRTDLMKTDQVVLISSASSITFNVKGDSCQALFMNRSKDYHSYLVTEIDGEFVERIAIIGSDTSIVNIVLPESQSYHTVSIYKATEAHTGDLIFLGLKAKSINQIPTKKKKYIEFIGNSITCGAASDASSMPCKSGRYEDHHNAYMAYGPIISRKLNADYMLSSVSGIGMYRNWNNETDPIMPQVYEQLYLRENSTKKYDFASKTPDVISICLGTNDFSDGDGKTERLAFNADQFTSNYVDFVQGLLDYYPEVQLVLLTSPMIGDNAKKEVLLNCLEKVKESFDSKKYKPIQIFEFKKSYTNGCSYHPNLADHQEIAEELIPLFEGLIK